MEDNRKSRPMAPLIGALVKPTHSSSDHYWGSALGSVEHSASPEANILVPFLPGGLLFPREDRRVRRQGRMKGTAHEVFDRCRKRDSAEARRRGWIPHRRGDRFRSLAASWRLAALGRPSTKSHHGSRIRNKIRTVVARRPAKTFLSQAAESCCTRSARQAAIFTTIAAKLNPFVSSADQAASARRELLGHIGVRQFAYSCRSSRRYQADPCVQPS